MPKIQEKEDTQISLEMLQAIKKDFPIDLFNVKAQRIDENGNTCILKYNNSQMKEYENRYIKKYFKTLEDEFVFEKYSTIWTSDENGKKYRTGYFCPRSFWENMFILISKES